MYFIQAEVYEDKAYLTNGIGEVISIFYFDSRTPIMKILTNEEIKDLEALRRKYK